MQSLIRPAVLADAPSIAHVHVQSWHETYRGLIPDAVIDGKSTEKRKAQWARGLVDGSRTTLVAERGDEVVGLISAIPDDECDALLQTLYVLRKAHRVGIGRQLLQRLAAALVARGMQSMRLYVLKENPAVQFYERMGAVLVREQDAPHDIGSGIRDYVFAFWDLRDLAGFAGAAHGDLSAPRE